MPNLAVDVDSWARSACYPRSTFYPLSDGPPTRGRRITRACFRTCSACGPRSQARLYSCIQKDGCRPSRADLRAPPLPFRRRPPQSNCPPGTVPEPVDGLGLGRRSREGSIPRAAPRGLAPPDRCLLPILYTRDQRPMPSCSEGSRGLSVLPRVSRIFTTSAISPGPWSRQRPSRCAFRAGRNLPDKEFRYLRTVIVTAAVYRGFNSELSLLLLTFRHRAGVSPYTSSFDLAETCVFAKQSPGPILCGSFEHSLFRSYGVNLPSSLTTLLPLALEFSSCPPVSVCGTGICFYTQSFSRLQPSVLPYSNFGPLRPGQPTPGSHPFEVSLCLNYRWLRNINRMCIGYAFRPDLSSRLTWSGRTFLQKP